MLAVSEEAKGAEFPGRLNPWDLLVWKLDSIENYIQREIGDLRREVGGVKQEITELRQELREEIRGTRRSYAVLELTAVLGFIAVIVAVFLARLV